MRMCPSHCVCVCVCVSSNACVYCYRVSNAPLNNADDASGPGADAEIGPFVVIELPDPFIRGACYGHVVVGDIVTKIEQYLRHGERQVDKTRGSHAINLSASEDEQNPTHFPVMLSLHRPQARPVPAIIHLQAVSIPAIEAPPSQSAAPKRRRT
jgi:hypothetical protein